MSAPMRYGPNGPKRATKVSLDQSLIAEARKLRINVSLAAGRGIDQAIAEKRAERWLKENKPPLDSSNEYVERDGLPLERYRQF
jgi:antitoxin CcdA